jgi:hypothetical protein
MKGLLEKQIPGVVSGYLDILVAPLGKTRRKTYNEMERRIVDYLHTFYQEVHGVRKDVKRKKRNSVAKV